MVPVFQQITHLVLIVLGLFMTPQDKDIVYFDYISKDNQKVISFEAKRIPDGYVITAYGQNNDHIKPLTIKKIKDSFFQFDILVDGKQSGIVDLQSLVTRFVFSYRGSRSILVLNNSTISLSVSPRSLILVNRDNADVLVFYGTYLENLQEVQKVYRPKLKKCSSSISLHFRLAEDSFQSGLDSYSLPDGKKIFLHKKILLSQDDVVNAFVDQDALGRYVIAITFSEDGRKRFASVTKNNRGKKLAILIDNKVLTAPVIMDTISSGRAQISGSFSREEAENIVMGLCGE